MDTATIFKVVNAVALLSWLLLIIFPYSEILRRLLFIIVITSFAALYTIMALPAMDIGVMEDFKSLSGVTRLFSDPKMVLIGWIHYLCFDLLAGLYIVDNARKHHISRWVIIPALLLTFMMGPFGLLLFIITKALFKKRLGYS